MRNAARESLSAIGLWPDVLQTRAVQDDRPAGDVSVELVTFTPLQECQWMHEAHHLTWDTPFGVNRIVVKDSR